MGRSAANHQGNVMELSGNFTLSGECSPCIKLFTLLASVCVSLGNGITSSFLPIYHYIFVDYSRQVSEKIASMQIELCGKTDLRFAEAMYKVNATFFAIFVFIID